MRTVMVITIPTSANVMAPIARGDFRVKYISGRAIHSI
jgi:hypothetical protein